jgi:hypothetical protein
MCWVAEKESNLRWIKFLYLVKFPCETICVNLFTPSGRSAERCLLVALHWPAHKQMLLSGAEGELPTDRPFGAKLSMEAVKSSFLV